VLPEHLLRHPICLHPWGSTICSSWDW